MYARDLLENYELSRKIGTLRRTMNDKKKVETVQMRWMSLVKRCAEFLSSSRSDCARRFPTCKMYKEGE